MKARMKETEPNSLENSQEEEKERKNEREWRRRGEEL